MVLDVPPQCLGAMAGRYAVLVVVDSGDTGGERDGPAGHGATVLVVGQQGAKVLGEPTWGDTRYGEEELVAARAADLPGDCPTLVPTPSVSGLIRSRGCRRRC